MIARLSSVPLLLFWLCLAGCASETKAPAAPAQPAAVAPPAAPVAEGTPYGVSDAPTSGEKGAPRPQMNAAAGQAYQAGMQAFQAGDLAGARAQFQRATQADPKSYSGYYSLAVVSERLGEGQSALNDYRQATLIVPDYEPAIVGYSVLLARTGKMDQAEEYLNGRVSAMPRSAAVMGALAEVKSLQGDSGAAQRYAQEALKRNPDYRPAMITLARDHYRSRRLDLALYTLKGILDGYGSENPPRDPENAEARLIRGLIYKEQGLRGPAIQELTKAIARRPDLVEARINLAAYLLESGNAAEAAQHLEAAVRFDLDNVHAHLGLGDAYRLLGKTAEAKRELEWVQKADPRLAQVHYNLGLLYLFSDNVAGLSPTQATDRAIAEFEQYKQMRPRVAGSNDDTDELITRAKSKKAVLEASQAAPAPAATSAAPAKPPPAAAATAAPPAAAKPPASTGSFAPVPSGAAPAPGAK
ncbi:MAG TPA: tetratricopeptide repeat protein [Polyangiaceae bacterium]|nr:tetratricopeptide repeat protein [Polyangiaceae bacterium]